MMVVAVKRGMVVEADDVVSKLREVLSTNTNLSPAEIEDRAISFWTDVSKRENVKYVLVPDQAPRALPQDRVKYKDKHNHNELKDLTAIDFMNSVYSDFVGRLYQFQLAEVDPPLLKAVRNQCSAQQLRMSDYIKSRHDFARERLGVDSASRPELDELKKEMRAISNGLAQLAPQPGE